MNAKLTIYKANKIISLRKIIAEKTAEENLNTAKKSPAFFEAFISRNELIPRLAKLKAEGTPCDELKKRYEELTAIISDELNKIGMTEKNVTPNYYCKICGDTGVKDGKNCKCFNNLLLRLTERELNKEYDLTKDLKELNSDIFLGDEKVKYETLVDKMIKTAEAFPNLSTRFLIFFGAPGTGKTYLAKAFAKEIERKGFGSVVISAFRLNNAFLNAHTSFEKDSSSQVSSLIDSDLLVIDDLGTEPTLKNVTIEYFTNLINERNKSGKLTVVTTNLSPEKIAEHYNERISSRLFDKKLSRAISFDFSDLRKNTP